MISPLKLVLPNLRHHRLVVEQGCCHTQQKNLVSIAELHPTILEELDHDAFVE